MDSSELRHRIAELRARKRNLPAARALFATLAVMVLAFGILRLWPVWWVGLPVVGVIGLMQYRLILAAHEATHKTLFHPVWLNEAVGCLVASLVGVSLFEYREAHLKHHRRPQSIQDDIDGYIYRPLLLARPGWPRLCLLITGNYRDILTKLRRKAFGDARVLGAAHAEAPTGARGGSLLRQFVPLVLAQAGVWVVLAWFIGGWAYFVGWLVPLFVIALQVDRARTFLEHGYQHLLSGPPNSGLDQAPQDTIDVSTNAVERFLFAPFGFSQHQAHHAQFSVPYYHLPELARLLEQHQPGYHRPVHGSYLVILTRMLWARA